jgi:hypothetical protein
MEYTKLRVGTYRVEGRGWRVEGRGQNSIYKVVSIVTVDLSVSVSQFLRLRHSETQRLRGLGA